MIIGIGFDLVDVVEFQSEVDAMREQWLERVFTIGERDYCEQQSNPYRSFAGTFAAKEALLKAFGTGWTDEIDWQDVEVKRDSGKPAISLKRSLLSLSEQMAVRNSFVSISYTKGHAAAVVVLEN